jgi:zinc protease
MRPSRRSLVVALALACTAPIAARAQSPTLDQRQLPDDPDIRTGRLPNGLTYYVLHNGYPARRAELRLVVNAGSILEEDDQRGLAHVLEHMAFDGSTNFPGHAIWDYLERVGMKGGADINASTSYEQTIYKLTIPTDSATIVENGLLILRDWAHGLTLDSAELERERKVVIEEWRLRRGASERIRDQQLSILLDGSRYPERQPIGLVSTLEHAPIERVRDFYRDWYRPDLMSVVIVGDVDADSMTVRLRQLFADVPAARNPRSRTVSSVPPHAAARVQIVTDSEATVTTLSLIGTYPHRRMRTVSDFRRALVESMYNSLLSARLSEAAHRADPPFLAASVSSSAFVRPLDAHQLRASVIDGGVLRGLAALRAEAARAARDGFTMSDLERQKDELLSRY